MYLLSLRIRNNLFICLLIFLFFCCNSALSQDVIERNYQDSTYNSVLDSEDVSYFDDSPTPLAKSSAVTLKTLVVKVSMLLFVLLVILAIVKIFLSRNRFSRVGSIFDEFTQKITSSLSNYAHVGGLKLKQTLMLVPGQNIYLVEIDGKRLLLGATHHGGIHFLADLTLEDNKKHVGIFSTMQLGEPQNNIKDTKKYNFELMTQGLKQHENNPFVTSTVTNSVNHSSENSTNGSNNQPLKRRVNFRQSLLKEI